MGTTNNASVELPGPRAGAVASPETEPRRVEPRGVEPPAASGNATFTAPQVVALLHAQSARDGDAIEEAEDAYGELITDIGVAAVEAGFALDALVGRTPQDLLVWLTRRAKTGGVVVNFDEGDTAVSMSIDGKNSRRVELGIRTPECDECIDACIEFWESATARPETTYGARVFDAGEVMAARRPKSSARAVKTPTTAQPASPARERLEVGGPEDAFHVVFTREPGTSRWVYGCEHIADELRGQFVHMCENICGQVRSASFPNIFVDDRCYTILLCGSVRDRDRRVRAFSGDPKPYIDALREALPVAREMVERARRAAKGGVA